MAHRPMKCESLMERDGTLLLDKIIYPKLASPKFDGNRCYIEDGIAKSSTGKPIRNDYIRRVLSNSALDGLDGELIVGSPTAKDVRRATTSGVSGFAGQPSFTFFVFDDYRNEDAPFEERLYSLHQLSEHPFIKPVEHKLIYDQAEMLHYEQSCLSLGYEGIVLRDPTAPYKQGRSTLKQNWALKLKRFVDGEAIIMGVEELLHNDNEATLNEHGYTQRSHHAENRRPGNTLGALLVYDVKTGVEFKVGTGFDANERALLWAKKDSLRGKIITYKHFSVGMKDKPNLPSFVAFRDVQDTTDDAGNPF